MVSATMKLNPEFIRIFLPSSTLVPSSRSTIGNWIFVLRAASTTQVIPKVAVVAVDPGPVVLGVIFEVVRIAGFGHVRVPFGKEALTRSGQISSSPHVDLDLPAGLGAVARDVRHPDPRSRHGENVPLVTTPPPTTGLPWRAIPALDRERHQLLRRPAAARGRDRLGPDEARRLPAAPAQARPRSARGPRSDRCRTGESTPRAAACRARPGRPGVAPAATIASHTSRRRRVHQQLDPVLAGVPGAAHQHRHAGDRCAGSSASAVAGRRRSATAPARERAGPGRRASRTRAAVDHVDVELVGVLLQPRKIAARGWPRW